MNKYSTLLVAGILLIPLAGCTQEKPNTPYATGQVDSQATQFCTNQGGVVSVEQSGSIDAAFCTIDGVKKDVWEYYSEMTISPIDNTPTASGSEPIDTPTASGSEPIDTPTASGSEPIDTPLIINSDEIPSDISGAEVNASGGGMFE